MSLRNHAAPRSWPSAGYDPLAMVDMVRDDHAFGAACYYPHPETQSDPLEEDDRWLTTGKPLD
jgi:hypothetical protein